MNAKIKIFTSTSSGGGVISRDVAASASNFTVSSPSGRIVGDTSSRDVENAIYAYLRALRSLQRTSVTAEEISKALNIPSTDVLRSMEALKKKGVKMP